MRIDRIGRNNFNVWLRIRKRKFFLVAEAKQYIECFAWADRKYFAFFPSWATTITYIHFADELITNLGCRLIRADSRHFLPGRSTGMHKEMKTIE